MDLDDYGSLPTQDTLGFYDTILQLKKKREMGMRKDKPPYPLA